MRGENDADCGEEQQDQDEQSTEEDGCAVTFSKMQVLVRIRPLLPGDGTEEEPQPAAAATHKSPNFVEVQPPRAPGGGTTGCFSCRYDAALGPDSSQRQLYAHVKGCVDAVLQGVNATVMAYGQTGSGKTFSMYGPPGYAEQLRWGGGESAGIVPRAVADVFKGLSAVQEGEDGKKNRSTAGERGNRTDSRPVVWCSMIQVYNEQVFDMLRDPQRRQPLVILEEEVEGGAGSVGSVYCQGLSEYSVHTAAECLSLLSTAEAHRAVRETHRNATSSRSHSILQLVVENVIGGRTLRGKLNMVDLAGSEKWDVNEDMSDAGRVSELTNINTSLHTLGRVIAALTSPSPGGQTKSTSETVASSLSIESSPDDPTASSSFLAPSVRHVPYRDSKLTRLLQDSLGGTAQTILIATLSPAPCSAHETVSTLRFADRARQVLSFIRLNDSGESDGNGEKLLIRRLRSEVFQLRAIVRDLSRKGPQNNGSTTVPAAAMSALAASATEGVAAAVSQARDAELDHLRQENRALRAAAEMATPSGSQKAVQLLSRNAALEAASNSLLSLLQDFFRFEIEEGQLKEATDSVAAQLRSTEAALGAGARQVHEGSSAPGSLVLPALNAGESALHSPSESLGSSFDVQGPASFGGSSYEPSAPVPPRSLSFRVRHRGHVREHHHSPDEQSDEANKERMLKTELKRAKQRMKKNLALQEWLQKREQMTEEALAQADAMAHEQEEARRREAAAFKRRAQAAKQKLKAYYASLREEEECLAPSVMMN